VGEATSAATRREPTLSRPQVSSRRARPSVSRSNTRSWTAASHASTGRPWDQPVTNAAPACFQSASMSEAPLSTTWILSGPERATQFSGHEAAMLTSTARRVPLALSKERNFSSSRCLTSECLCPSTYSTTLRGGDGLEPGTATSGCGTSRAVRHWDRAGARDQKPPAGSRQTAADGANVRRRASSGQAERPGGGGRFLTATLDA
jgi:hypothetical protein